MPSAPPGLPESRAALDEDGYGAMHSDSLEERLHRFCWVDLATTHEDAAKSFYCRLFGWTVRDCHVGEGRFSTFAQNNAPFASLYQLTQRQIAAGVPSHWTPYVSVGDVDAAASLAVRLEGQLIVPPHDVAGIARISLISDPAGALIGLWQQLRASDQRDLL